MFKILCVVVLTILFYTSSMNFKFNYNGNTYFKNPNSVLFEKYDDKVNKIILDDENQLIIVGINQNEKLKKEVSK